MAAGIKPLPDDYRLPTTGLEMLTGGAAKALWRNWGYVDGWNWVAGGERNLESSRIDAFAARGLDAEQRGVEHCGLILYDNGWNGGMSAAREAAAASAPPS